MDVHKFTTRGLVALFLLASAVRSSAQDPVLRPVLLFQEVPNVKAGLGPPLAGDVKPGKDKDADVEMGPVPRPLPLAAGGEVYPIDLPTALRLANASNPTIAIARERVQQAYFRQRQAEALWLPNLQAGGAYTRHDGLTQNQRGDVFRSNRWSFFDGGGALLKVETADALFGPLIARQLTQAQADASRAATYQLQLEVVFTYFDLVEAYGRLAINQETLANAREMAKNAEAAQLAGTGKTPADAQRARAEVHARLVERNDLQARAAEIGARLAQLLMLPPTVELQPADTGAAAMDLVSLQTSLEELLALGLQNRPEVASSRALIGAAETRWKQARFSPLVPRLEAFYTAGSFRAGQRDDLADIAGRGDGGVQAVWELQNFGLGNVAKARLRRSQLNETNFHLAEVQAQVTAEISAAAKNALARRQSFLDAQKGVREAMEVWRRLRESAFGLGGRDRRFDPLEPLIAEQQLNAARNLLLSTIINYNKAQFRLYTALGQPPECGLPEVAITALPTSPIPQTTPTKDNSNKKATPE